MSHPQDAARPDSPLLGLHDPVKPAQRTRSDSLSSQYHLPTGYPVSSQRRQSRLASVSSTTSTVPTLDSSAASTRDSHARGRLDDLLAASLPELDARALTPAPPRPPPAPPLVLPFPLSHAPSHSHSSSSSSSFIVPPTSGTISFPVLRVHTGPYDSTPSARPAISRWSLASSLDAPLDDRTPKSRPASPQKGRPKRGRFLSLITRLSTPSKSRASPHETWEHLPPVPALPVPQSAPPQTGSMPFLPTPAPPTPASIASFSASSFSLSSDTEWEHDDDDTDEQRSSWGSSYPSSPQHLRAPSTEFTPSPAPAFTRLGLRSMSSLPSLGASAHAQTYKPSGLRTLITRIAIGAPGGITASPKPSSAGLVPPSPSAPSPLSLSAVPPLSASATFPINASSLPPSPTTRLRTDSTTLLSLSALKNSLSSLSSPKSASPLHRAQSAFTLSTSSTPLPKPKAHLHLGPKPPKRKLLISGIHSEEGYESVKAWCEAFGEVKRIGWRSPSAPRVLVVDFKERSVADTVCRLQAKVHIKGAGSVDLSWSTDDGKKVFLL